MYDAKTQRQIAIVELILWKIVLNSCRLKRARSVTVVVVVVKSEAIQQKLSTRFSARHKLFSKKNVSKRNLVGQITIIIFIIVFLNIMPPPTIGPNDYFFPSTQQIHIALRVLLSVFRFKDNDVTMLCTQTSRKYVLHFRTHNFFFLFLRFPQRKVT